MSLLGATILTGIATAVLAVGAIVTAVLAYLAFRKQAREVAAIERQVSDGQELARQQAELLKVQSGQMELQREQLMAQGAANALQAEANARQAEVLDLQATELRESLEQRKRAAEEQRSAQASRVFIWEYVERSMAPTGIHHYVVTAHVVNTSDQPVYDATLRWHRGSAPEGEPNPEPLPTVMPGDDATASRKFPPDSNMDVSGAVLRFRDAAGIVWMRRPDGGLIEQQ